MVVVLVVKRINEKKVVLQKKLECIGSAAMQSV